MPSCSSWDPCPSPSPSSSSSVTKAVVVIGTPSPRLNARPCPCLPSIAHAADASASGPCSRLAAPANPAVTPSAGSDAEGVPFGAGSSATALARCHASDAAATCKLDLQLTADWDLGRGGSGCRMQVRVLDCTGWQARRKLFASGTDVSVDRRAAALSITSRDSQAHHDQAARSTRTAGPPASRDGVTLLASLEHIGSSHEPRGSRRQAHSFMASMRTAACNSSRKPGREERKSCAPTVNQMQRWGR